MNINVVHVQSASHSTFLALGAKANELMPNQAIISSQVAVDSFAIQTNKTFFPCTY